MPRRITTFIFDFDDTIVDSFSARLCAIEQVLSNAGVRHQSGESLLRNLDGGLLVESLGQLERRERRPLDLFESFRRTYWGKKVGKINLYPGIGLVLQTLSDRNLKLGIVTSKSWSFEMDGRNVGASQELMELGISHLFSVGVGFETVCNHKPHPEGILLALNQLEARPQECVVVGDSHADIEAARAAGCWSCHAVWGVPPMERDRIGAGADVVVDKPEALLDLPFV